MDDQVNRLKYLTHGTGALLVAVSLGVAVSPRSASAADLKVSYLVDAPSLQKNTHAGTPLTFEVYVDPNCTTKIASQTVNVEAVSLIEQAKALRVRGAPKPPSVAEILLTMSGLPVVPVAYARVSGTGIIPVNSSCQLQSAPAGPQLATPSAVVIDARAATVGSYSGFSYVEDQPQNFVLIGHGVGAGILGFTRGALYSVYPDTLAVFYTSADCSTQPLMQVETTLGVPRGAVLGTSALLPPFTSPPFPTTLHSAAIGPYIFQPQGFTSQDCSPSAGAVGFLPPNSCCYPFSGDLQVDKPSASIDLSSFVPPFTIQ